MSAARLRVNSVPSCPQARARGPRDAFSLLSCTFSARGGLYRPQRALSSRARRHAPEITPLSGRYKPPARERKVHESSEKASRRSLARACGQLGTELTRSREQTRDTFLASVNAGARAPLGGTWALDVPPRRFGAPVRVDSWAPTSVGLRHRRALGQSQRCCFYWPPSIFATGTWWLSALLVIAGAVNVRRALQRRQAEEHRGFPVRSYNSAEIRSA